MKWEIKREGRGEKLVERESDLEERRKKKGMVGIGCFK